MIYLLQHPDDSSRCFFANTTTEIVPITWAQSIDEAITDYQSEPAPHPHHNALRFLRGEPTSAVYKIVTSAASMAAFADINPELFI
jgi:hypothetical protein